MRRSAVSNTVSASSFCWWLLWAIPLSASLGCLSLSLSGVKATTPVSGGIPAIVRPLLKPGDKGANVVELQATLTLLGFFTEPVTGVYDLATATAVSRFQQAAGIKVDGLAGKETWDRLFPPIARSPIANQANPAKTATQPSTVSPTATGGDAVTTFPTPAAVRSTPAQPGAKPVTVARKPAPVALPVLKLGMRGSAVTQLQERLQALGFLKGEVDGVFGSDTEASVVNLQQHYQIEVDGVVGETTWGVLLR